MKDLNHILNKITELTLNIETNYPELYRTLDENPMTLPETSHPHIDKNVLQNYLDSLTQLLEHHLEMQKNK